MAIWCFWLVFLNWAILADQVRISDPGGGFTKDVWHLIIVSASFTLVAAALVWMLPENNQSAKKREIGFPMPN